MGLMVRGTGMDLSAFGQVIQLSLSVFVCEIGMIGINDINIKDTHRTFFFGIR